MNIFQIKAEIAAKCGVAVPNLVMVRQLTEDKQPTEWLSHWDNDNRIRVTMHEDVFKKIQADPKKCTGLAIKKSIEEATDERAAYTRIIVITPQHIVGTF